MVSLTEKEFDRIYAIRYREDSRFPTTSQEDDTLTRKIMMILLLNTEIYVPGELKDEFEAFITKNRLKIIEENLDENLDIK